jgi:hypothetical protein
MRDSNHTAVLKLVPHEDVTALVTSEGFPENILPASLRVGTWSPPFAGRERPLTLPKKLVWVGDRLWGDKSSILGHEGGRYLMSLL